ncbi:MAG: methyl-accepting chemotaxis protein [Clostridiaceae bacterium]|nr:methyl-accepting chemotaxis protein [Clostridiaceae bacterium]
MKKIPVHSIQFKITALFISFIIFCTIIVSAIGFYEAKVELTEAGIRDITHLLDASIVILESLNDQVVSGNMTLDEAQQKAKLLLNGPINSNNERDISKVKIKYENDGYVFALNSNQFMVMHPYLEGQDMRGQKSKDGKVDLIHELVTQEQEIDVIYYNWYNKEGEPLQKKVAVTRYFEPWDWYVSTSAYIHEFDSHASHVIKASVLPIFVLIIIAIIISLIISSRLTKPVIQFTEAMETFSKGDLTHQIKIKGIDELSQLGRYINHTAEKISNMIRGIARIADSMAAHANILNKNSDESSKAMEQVAQTIDNVAQGASQQASAAQKGAEMIAELDKEIKSINNYASEMIEATEKMNITNQEGIQAVEVLQNTFNESITAAGKINQGISRLIDKSHEINKIISVIDSIAKQTNLLALNAAIEAARAGEYGRGFSVVAEEIRKLAEQSQQSTKSVAQLIKDVQGEINENASLIEQINGIIENQKKAVEHTNMTFSNITLVSEQLVHRIENITASINQINKSSSEMVDVINDVSAVSQQSAAASQEVAAATEQQIAAIQEISSSVNVLAGMSNDLWEMIKVFKLQ